MNTSCAILGLLDKVRTTTLKHFQVLDTYIYDENLDFRGRASQYYAREGVFSQIEGVPPNDWIFIIWNRSSISASNFNNRPISATANSFGLNSGNPDSKTTFRMASLDVGFKIVTNNIEISETIEEHLYVNAGEFVVFEADYGSLGTFTCSSQSDKTVSWDKEDINEVGPVMGVGIYLNINYPVIMPAEISPFIGSINSRLWVEKNNIYSLASQKIIT